MASSPKKLRFPKPLGGKPPVEHHLSDAPLERVIAAVRFPVLIRVEEDKSALSRFQSAIRHDFPILQEMQSQLVQIQVGPSAPIALPTVTRIWQFSDAPGAWKVTLARDALSIETISYESRANLLARWGHVIEALKEAFDPDIVLRIGTRYVDRIVGDQFKSFESLIKPELLGSAIAKLKRHLKYSLSETSLVVEEGDLLLRYGVLAPNMSPDPSAISPVLHDSFLLDIDVWSNEQRHFETGSLLTAFHQLSERAYSVFRFSVTDEFLKVYEGHP
jgi:uncharacterized protein (TIGR04255 family)